MSPPTSGHADQAKDTHMRALRMPLAVSSLSFLRLLTVTDSILYSGIETASISL
jgi:hypothetical protein